MNDCIFCAKANGDPRDLIWSNQWVAAFKTIDPKAPVHVLLVPKRHIENVDDLDDKELAGEILMAIKEVAAAAGVKGAYRVHINNGKGAGQVVMHWHIHIMGRMNKEELDDVRGEGL